MTKAKANNKKSFQIPSGIRENLLYQIIAGLVVGITILIFTISHEKNESKKNEMVLKIDLYREAFRKISEFIPLKAAEIEWTYVFNMYCDSLKEIHVQDIDTSFIRSKYNYLALEKDKLTEVLITDLCCTLSSMQLVYDDSTDNAINEFIENVIDKKPKLYIDLCLDKYIDLLRSELKHSLSNNKAIINFESNILVDCIENYNNNYSKRMLDSMKKEINLNR